MEFSFGVDEAASLFTYSLDNQSNVSITGNFTLTDLSYGAHNLTLYVTDQARNIGYKTFSFKVNEPFPTELAVALAAIAVTTIGILVYFKKRKR